MTTLSKRHFWEWFKRHNQEYLDLKNKSKKEAIYWLNELNTHLRAYFKCLGYAMEWDPLKQARLIITVNGKARHFKKADDLVAKAPVIPGWEIIALEDPRPLDFMLENEIRESGIDPKELRFSYDRGVLNVYHFMCNPANEGMIARLANHAAYNLLGERSFGMNISYVEAGNLSGVDAESVLELEMLPSYVCVFSSMGVDENGRLVNR